MGVRKHKQIGGQLGEWIVTYGDMVTLLLCFFVALFDPNQMDAVELASIATSFQTGGLGSKENGNTLAVGKLEELGNNVATLPSNEKGKSLSVAKKKAVSLFTPEIKSNKVRITTDERGLVISLAADSFFASASAQVNIEQARDSLVKIADFLKTEELVDPTTGLPRSFRLEGHTDKSPVDPNGAWPSNWELSAQRPINVLHILTDFGVDETRFQVAGFADTKPLADNGTPEGRAYNRRVDLIILDSGHL